MLLVTPFSAQSSPSSLILTIKDSNNLHYSFSSSCSSTLFADACAFSTDGSGNVRVTFSSITFTTTATNLIVISIDSVVVSSTATLTVGAIFSINGSPSLSTSTPASVSQMYSQAVSNYSLSQSSHLLGQSSSSVTVTIGFSAGALAKISTIDVFVPQ